MTTSSPPWRAVTGENVLKPESSAPDQIRVTDLVRAEISELTAGVEQRMLLLALILATAVLSIAGAAVGHPVFHLKLVTALGAGKLMWPLVVHGDG